MTECNKQQNIEHVLEKKVTSAISSNRELNRNEWACGWFNRFLDSLWRILDTDFQARYRRQLPSRTLFAHFLLCKQLLHLLSNWTIAFFLDINFELLSWNLSYFLIVGKVKTIGLLVNFVYNDSCPPFLIFRSFIVKHFCLLSHYVACP